MIQYKVAHLLEESMQPGGNILVKGAKVVILSEGPDKANRVKVSKYGNYLETGEVSFKKLKIQ